MAAIAGFGRTSFSSSALGRGGRQSARVCRAVQPPNVTELCERARLSLTPQEAADIEPQISRVVDWFGQLQGVKLDDVDPAVRVGDVSSNACRSDEHLDFQGKDSMLDAVGDREGAFIKVPRILNEDV